MSAGIHAFVANEGRRCLHCGCLAEDAEFEACRVFPGPVASFVQASIVSALSDPRDPDATLLSDERHYVCDIADVMGASILHSVRSAILDTLATAGV